MTLFTKPKFEITHEGQTYEVSLKTDDKPMMPEQMNYAQASYISELLFPKSKERQLAVVDVITNKLISSDAEREYGLPTNSVSRDVRNVKKRYEEVRMIEHLGSTSKADYKRTKEQ